MIELLTGENTYKLEAYLAGRISEFVKEFPDGLEKFEATEISDKDFVLDSVRSISFLSPRKLVVIEDYFQNKDLVGITGQLIEQCSDTTDLYIVDVKPDKRLSEYKLLVKSCAIIDFKKDSPVDLTNWMITTAKDSGAIMDDKTASYLVGVVGEDQNLLKNEIDKLALYTDQVTTKTIDLLCEQAPSGKIFSMLESLFKGEFKKALDLYHDQLAQGAEMQLILSMIIWQLQQITLAVFAPGNSRASLIASGVSSYNVQKLLDVSKSIDKPTLKRYVQRLNDIDAQSKTDSDLESAMTLYFSEVAFASNSR